MYKQKSGMSLACDPEIGKTIKLLKQIGFDAVSPVWHAEYLKDAVSAANESGMILQSLHAPFDNVDKMWNENKEISQPVIFRLMSALEDCNRYEIPVMVSHVWIGFDNIGTPTETGFENFGKVIEKAREYGVKIAFENTEGDNYLYALMEYFKGDKTVGFCWYSGHEMCYNYSKDLLADFGDRLLVTHLNDNLGISDFGGKIYWTDDLHLLPFDGIADWDYNAKRLKNSNKLDILNFELNIRSKPGRYENLCYEKMSFEEYYTECYKRACRVAAKINY